MLKLLTEKPHSTVTVSTKTTNGEKNTYPANQGKLNPMFKLILFVATVQLVVGGYGYGYFLFRAENHDEIVIDGKCNEDWTIACRLVAETVMAAWLFALVLLRSSKGLGYWLGISLAFFIVTTFMMSCRLEQLTNWKNTAYVIYQSAMVMYLFQMFLVAFACNIGDTTTVSE